MHVHGLSQQAERLTGFGNIEAFCFLASTLPQVLTPLLLPLQIVSINERTGTVRHDCATEGGSSGSPAFDTKGRLVCLHRANIPSKNINCGTSVVAIAGWITAIDLGTYLWSVQQREKREMVVHTRSWWPVGSTIKVAFLAGDYTLKSRVFNAANQWFNPTANIR
jgi:hypothetical protein